MYSNHLQAVPMTSGSSVTCWGPPTLQSGPREREQCYIHHTTIWPPSQTSPSFIIQQGCYIPMVWEGFALRKCLACLDSSKYHHSSMRDISSNYTFSLIPRPSVQCVCTVLRVWEWDYYTLYVLPTSMEWHWSLYVETTHGDLWNLVTMVWPMGLQKLLQSKLYRENCITDTELCYSLCASWNIQLAAITGVCLVYLVRSISLLQCCIRLFNPLLLLSQSVNGWIQNKKRCKLQ